MAEEIKQLSQSDSTCNSTKTLQPPSELSLYFDPLETCNPKVVANHVDYFKNEKKIHLLKPIKPSKIRTLIMYPAHNSAKKYEEMKTLTPQGTVIPAHLPNYEDLYGLHPAFRILMLWELEKMNIETIYNVLPKEYESLFDPLPKISFDVPVYTVGDEKSRICMATYADVVHIMKVMSTTTMLRIRVLRNLAEPPITKSECSQGRSFNEVVVTPIDVSHCTFVLPVEHGSKIVIWNARSIARPSFIKNFYIMCEKHDPLIVVVLEARISRKNIVDVLEKIPLDYKCAVIGDGGWFSGGVVMFYKEDDCTIRQVGCPLPNCDASVEFEGIFRQTPRKRLLDITELSSDSSEGSPDI